MAVLAGLRNPAQLTIPAETADLKATSHQLMTLLVPLYASIVLNTWCAVIATLTCSLIPLQAALQPTFTPTPPFNAIFDLISVISTVTLRILRKY